MNRRLFMTQAALGASALVNADASPLFRSADTRKLGIALVGLGTYSTVQLGPALQHTERCRLAGIVTGTPAKAQEWMAKYNIPKENVYNYQTFDRIADNPNIDIVYVVLPNSMHAEYVIRAAKAGKHVICEKPMGLNVGECEQMVQACKKAGVKLSVGYRLYFEPHHLEVRRLAQSQELGTVKLMETALGFSMANPNSWRLNKQMGGGGAIMDLGVYAIQGARRTIGEDPIAVTAQGFVRDKTIFKDIYESMFFQMEFPGGALSNSTTTYTSYVDRLHATTGHEWFGLQPSFNATGAKGDSSKGKIDLATPPFQQIRQMDAFAATIINNTDPVASAAEGIKDLHIIDAIVRSADTGRRIEIDWKRV
ncbi:Gfo/Idh/MocA family protein [Fibrella forsythiae]|uniref:Gfo/Idh/MocA family oxidoreductase n=1 Tax=Fibrella forsythiae TaxID=2817061 RepID=A0ABS3JK71_9BACT|nr:Gfo/Idh/MocA family oxidoreductase [Fibrella forsythiae]MBO0950410.1 Gfo/Idh/MocA family oxidoreductase [Fibrella forsythiae]